MKKIHERCCGLDVHKKSITACLIMPAEAGKSAQVIRTFGTTTAALLELVDWFVQSECTIAAMESTGSYWKPVYNLLEGALEVWVGAIKSGSWDAETLEPRRAIEARLLILKAIFREKYHF